ncbi:MAG: flavodoxin family protein [Candidatus Bathyarchaeota archaeon]|nr:flavodoxin family protein [Candidatus Bathyarchaeota archaeon]
MKTLIVLYSYHHNNTEKVARVISGVLNAEIKKPSEVNLDEVGEYDLIGFGSGIYSDKHHPTLLELAERLPETSSQRAFIFTTSAITSESKIASDHNPIRDILLSKGFEIAGEYQCVGFNTNSFLKYFGGMNKNRPNAYDLDKAEAFARKLVL